MIARVASFEGVDVQAAKSTMEDAEPIIRPVIASLDGFQLNLCGTRDGSDKPRQQPPGGVLVLGEQLAIPRRSGDRQTIFEERKSRGQLFHLKAHPIDARFDDFRRIVILGDESGLF